MRKRAIEAAAQNSLSNSTLVRLKDLIYAMKSLTPCSDRSCQTRVKVTLKSPLGLSASSSGDETRDLTGLDVPKQFVLLDVLGMICASDIARVL